MKTFRTKSKKLAGTRWAEVYKKAFTIYKQIRAKSKRRPYIKSAFFKKDKIFLELYWHHLHEKVNLGDKTRRVKFFPCAIELVCKSTYEPESKENPNNRGEIVHRFAGITADDDLFYIQIKEEKRSGKKWLMSAFPVGK